MSTFITGHLGDNSVTGGSVVYGPGVMTYDSKTFDEGLDWLEELTYLDGWNNYRYICKVIIGDILNSSFPDNASDEEFFAFLHAMSDEEKALFISSFRDSTSLHRIWATFSQSSYGKELGWPASKFRDEMVFLADQFGIHREVAFIPES